ncbi:Rho/RAC guanine nucleotide exchange factor [Entamoeba marina]
MLHCAALCKGKHVRLTYSFQNVLNRYYFIKEFSETEVSFVHSMKYLNTLFKEPLIKANNNVDTTIIPSLMIESVLPQIDKVFINGCIIANRLEDAKTYWKYDSLFTPVLEQCIKLMTPLAEYTLSFEKQKLCLAQARKIKSFNDFINTQSRHKELCELSFNDLIIMPVQRLMRYPILLDGLIKVTSPTHPDYTSLLRIRTDFKRLVENVNNLSKLHDRLLDVSTTICGISTLVQPWRYCLYYGFLYVNSPSKKSFGFIFSDRLCYVDDVCTLHTRNSFWRYFSFENSQQIRFEKVDRFGPSGELPRTYELRCGDIIEYLTIPEDEAFDIWATVLSETLQRYH